MTIMLLFHLLSSPSISLWYNNNSLLFDGDVFALGIQVCIRHHPSTIKLVKKVLGGFWESLLPLDEVINLISAVRLDNSIQQLTLSYPDELSFLTPLLIIFSS